MEIAIALKWGDMRRIGVLCASLMAGFAWGAEYYLSPNGIDENEGTSLETPLATFREAFGRMDPGDTLYLLEGTYEEEFQLSNFGGSSDPETTIQAYEGAEVVFSGFEELDELKAEGASWISHEGNIFKIQLAEPILQLFVDGEQMIPARWPNARWDDGSWWKRDETMAHGGVQSVNGSQYDLPMNGNSLASLDFDLAGATAVMNVGSWKTYARTIESHTAGQEFFTYPKINNTYKTKTKTHRYWVEGVLRLLDSELEWFLDTDENTLYLWGPNGEIPGGRIYGKTRTYALDLSNAKNLRIQGIRFEGVTLRGSNCDGLVLEDCSFWYPTFNRRMLGDMGSIPITEFSGTDDASIINCRFEHVEGSALDLAGNRNLIDNCYFYDIDWSCANIPGLGVTLRLSGSNNTIRYTTIRKTSASSTIDLSNASVVEYCDISETGFLQNDGTTVQVTKLAQADAVIRYNWDHDTIKKGIRFDTTNNGTFGYDGDVYRNVAFRTGAQGIHLKGDRHRMVNNTSFGNLSNDIVMNYDFADENINSETLNNAGDQVSGDRNNPKALPGRVEGNWSGEEEEANLTGQFRDFSNYDFRPKQGSGLIDAGVEVPGITDGYFGDAPDAGAYEFGDPHYWIPGYKERKASFPIPANKATEVYLGSALIWKEAYKAIRHRLYLGNDVQNLKLIGEYETGNIFEPGGLDAGQAYFWRVDAVLNDGSLVEGDVWTFTTKDSEGEPLAEAYRAWLLEHFSESEIALESVAERGSDPDLDSMNNYEEFLAGTSPVNEDSRLRVSIDARFHEGKARLLFSPILMKREYALSHSSDLIVWEGRRLLESEKTSGYVDTEWDAHNASRFYQLIVSP
ncbi:right-handed parallel beta-helix repeat-containing protein [Pelagicoccus mobilis]|uniref:Right-handed parallel beta-helix repeat-containing protein n=1 Tax=Pelagicoccus mobilis TaxID=415221 RepID=A0A934VJW6_9BACT|nr:right-handed parallel beta-helix repeat-containing protein [Pelagicoccus mobilis]MBK1876051.1 right-handed parallel beta-helix repeat-containing protein [Pelagicoccus mobilis]